MNKTLIIASGIVASMFLVAVIGIIWVVSIFNGEVKLHTRYEAQKNVVESTMDTMRKVLMNQYQVNKEFADTFVKCVAMQAEGRKGGSLFKMVTESSGNVVQGFNPELASKMMNSIEGKMNEFKRAQDVYVDVWREHKTFCSLMPNSFFVGGKVLPQPVVISSSSSKEAMETGKLSDNIIGK